MKKSLKSPREILLGYLGGSEKKLDFYLNRLASCSKPFDVAERVIKQMYIEEGIDQKELCMRAFYGPIVGLAPMMRGEKLKESTLYYHITENLSRWRKERALKLEREKREPEDSYVDTRVEWRADGSFDTFIHLHSRQLPDDMKEILRAFMKMAYARQREKNQNTD